MGTIAEKLTYLNTTKIKLRDSLNKFGSNILSTDTFRSYDTKLNDIYDKLPKVTQSGAGLTITPVQNGQVDDFKMIGTDLYQNQLPSEYTAVEYLQSDNECFIDTGINADYKLSLKMKMAYLGSGTNFMGAIKNTGSSYIRHHFSFNNSNIGFYIGETNTSYDIISVDNNYHNYDIDVYNKKITIDNTNQIISYNNFDLGVNYYLFARNNNNTNLTYGQYKIAYCKMYYQGNLVRDFAPCYRNSDSVAGLYDFVTNTFFTNQGTGTFTVGNTITLPNPDYPQEIKVVEGRQVITDKGKNLFDVSQTPHSNSMTSAGVTLNINDDGTISTSGTNTETYRNIRYDIQLPAGEYIISGCPTGGSKNGYSLLVQLTDETSSQVFDTGSGATFSLQETTTIKFYPVRVGSDTVNFNGLIFKPMIRLSNISNDTFEPYYEPVSYNIDLHGKNEFDGEYEDGYYNMNGTKPSTQDPYGRRSTNLNEIKPNTNYIISINNNIISEAIRVFFYDANRKFISTESISNGTFTSPAECYYVSWHSSSLKQNYPDGLPNMMIEQGQTVTTYEDYYDYKLAKIPNTDYKNRIYKNNGNWYFEENVKKAVLDGSENWETTSSIPNTSRFYFSSDILNSRDSDDNNIYIITDKFKGISWKDIYSDDTTIKNAISNYNNSSNISGRIYIRIDNNYASTTNELKTWLSTNNVEVWYILATPVTTQITNTTLINQLEAISVHTGTNIITISNDNNIIPEIEITRLKELEKLA